MCNHHLQPERRRLLLAGAAGLLLSACGAPSGDGGASKVLVPIEIDRGTSCSLDGMLLADYPGPKAQIHYRGAAQPEWFCDTIEMFNIYLNPEQARGVAAVYVQDMGKADWEQPVGNWIDARSAFYVFGSKRLGSMGPTAASFATEADANAFIGENGGKLVRFDEVQADMVVLDGGALHDQSM